MDTNQPSIPDFKQDSHIPPTGKGSTEGNSSNGKSAGSGDNGGNFTPLKKGDHFKISKKGIIVALTLLIAIIVPITGYYVYTTTQTTDSSAATCPDCLTGGVPPLPIDPVCEEGKHVLCSDIKQGKCTDMTQAEIDDIMSTVCKPPTLALRASQLIGKGCPVRDGCPAPQEGFCKRKGACFECRFGSACGLKMLCPCGEPTPTPFQKSECASPNTCVDTATAAAQGCIPPDTVADASLQCPLSNNTGVGYCCPKVEVACEPPKTCIALPDGVDPSQLCKEGTIDKAGSAACSTNGTQGICCEPPVDTPPPSETPTPTETPTPGPSETPTPGPSETPTPEITRACVLPTLDIEVECLQCGDTIGVE